MPPVATSTPNALGDDTVANRADDLGLVPKQAVPASARAKVVVLPVAAAVPVAAPPALPPGLGLREPLSSPIQPPLVDSKEAS